MNLMPLLTLLSLIFCLQSIPAKAITLGIYPIENIDFGELTPLVGRCDMDHLTGTVSNTIGDNCTNKGTSRGLYRIVAEKNTLIRVTVYTKTDTGDGIEFRPSGTISSSEWTSPISPGSFIDINSGPTGWIDITVGGALIIHSPQSPGSEISVDFDIEHVPTP